MGIPLMVLAGANLGNIAFKFTLLPPLVGVPGVDDLAVAVGEASKVSRGMRS